jgi:hypothetical protein
MLRHILQRIAGGSTWTIEALARDLGTTPDLVTTMIDALVQQGYLKQAGQACSSSCASCSTAGSCVKGIGQKVWTLNPEKVIHPT